MSGQEFSTNVDAVQKDDATTMAALIILINGNRSLAQTAFLSGSKVEVIILVYLTHDAWKSAELQKTALHFNAICKLCTDY